MEKNNKKYEMTPIFINELRIKAQEKIKLEQLKKDYEENKMAEEEITEEQKEKLIELYKKQNKEIIKNIENKKAQIRKLLNELKK